MVIRFFKKRTFKKNNFIYLFSTAIVKKINIFFKQLYLYNTIIGAVIGDFFKRINIWY